ncbi:erythromycin esterase family protein [Brachybacterium fresconis]|uniref:Erythromycin esterase n=1 Tax=Brachybacterium fresconis TaxID=173363 RepID=A0ABS4YJV0_9MICO|nr:erythromycin esterase family protein [Brachybacterium fresconis]MBP2409058.1 erythromycin esterase [Brachybacterium fresconis]
MTNGATMHLSEWLAEHGAPQRYLDPDAPLDELEPVADLVGDARVVALGESSHHISEFYRIRHRLLRYLVERRGFTMLALEAPFTEAEIVADWVAGGPGDVERVASEGIAMSLGDAPEMHETLRWMRARNAREELAVHCVGTDLPGSIGSPMPALERVAPYMRELDPGSAAALERAIELVAHYDLPLATMALAAYATLPEHDRDAVTGALSELVARSQRMASHHHATGQQAEHAEVMHHLRGAWLLDQVHRAFLSEDMGNASTFRDVYLAESVLRLLESDPSAKIVLAAHNWHIKKTPERAEDGQLLYPAGYHLAAALGDEYRSIGLTARGGRTTVTDGAALDGSGAFPFQQSPQPGPEPDCVESAFAGDAPWTLADLRRAAPSVTDAARFTRMRMADYFLEQPAFESFDGLACVAESSGTRGTRKAG